MLRRTEHLYIVTDDQILGSEPIIDGTRTPVRAILESLFTGQLLYPSFGCTVTQRKHQQL
jgi:uncharacterized protein (DUF433 family)